jgi:DNA-binding MarR family transcriptional regulator
MAQLSHINLIALTIIVQAIKFSAMDLPLPKTPEPPAMPATPEQAVAESPPQAVNFYHPDHYQRCDSIGWLLLVLQRSIRQQAELRLAGSGLTHAQWVPLLMLRLGGACAVTKLMRELDSDAGALSRLLDRLEAKGLCQRERSTEDRRVVMVSLTDEGWRISAQLPSMLSDIFNAHLFGFSHNEWRLLMSLLHRLIANGDALRQTADGCPARPPETT